MVIDFFYYQNNKYYLSDDGKLTIELFSSKFPISRDMIDDSFEHFLQKLEKTNKILEDSKIYYQDKYDIQFPYADQFALYPKCDDAVYAYHISFHDDSTIHVNTMTCLRSIGLDSSLRASSREGEAVVFSSLLEAIKHVDRINLKVSLAVKEQLSTRLDNLCSYIERILI